jgi:hypothetical protein
VAAAWAAGETSAAGRAAAAWPPARVIASGLLAGQEFAPAGMVVRERRELDGWAAVVLEAA